jgi:predicted transcriptional regulator
MQEELRSLLFEAGLNEAEILIYLELLKSPTQSKWELVKSTKLDKNKVYRAFDRLIELNMVAQRDHGIEALSLDYLLADLEAKRSRTQQLVSKIKEFSPFMKIPIEAVSDFQILDTKEKILEKYIEMSEIDHDTCLDFGDLENFVNVLGGLDPVFKFRKNRFAQNAKNIAICTNTGPNTSCMMRRQDMENYKSDIDLLNIKFKDKWIIFSDTNDYVMFNNFKKDKEPSSVLVKSKAIADTQRAQFDQFNQNMQSFSQ